jgi:hypothetical protein
MEKQETRVKQVACYMLHNGFQPALVFNPEDEGNMFLRNMS